MEDPATEPLSAEVWVLYVDHQLMITTSRFFHCLLGEPKQVVKDVKSPI